MSKTEFFDGIGEITFVNSKRAKNIGISIRPFKGVRVTVPHNVSHRAARKVLVSKLDWIKKNLPRIETFESQQTIFDENSVFSTKDRILKIESWDKEQFRTSIKENLIHIKYPDTEDVYAPEIQKKIKKSIEKVWRIEGEKYFTEKLSYLAQKYGFKYKSLVVKTTTSKWGSCSYDNQILLSSHLMRVPVHLQNYVMIHELCHTVEKNHQPPFWKLMDKVTNGRARALDKEMKTYSTKIY